MNKKIWVGLLALMTIVALVLGGLPYYLGIKAEQSLRQQQALLANTSFLQVEQHTYQRGWFASTETTVIRFKPGFLAGLQQQLPDNIQTILREPITLKSHIRHGLFANGLTPVRAQVETEFAFSPEAEKVLMRFFGQQAPVTLTNTIDLSGDGVLQWQIPSFDYEELSGIKMVWQGLQSHMRYQAGFEQYDTQTTSPGLSMVLADKGEVAYQGLMLDTHTEDGQNQLALGSSKLTLKQFSMQWHEGVQYDIRINELINLMTDLQIGAFINPHGSVVPSKVVLDDLAFDTHMQENGEWIMSQGRFGFAQLHYGDDVYGPLAIEASAEHLHAPSLLAIKHKLTELAQQNLDAEAMRDAMVAMAREEGQGLFTHDPIIKLNRFQFQMPEGLVDVSGQLGFKGLTAQDMQHVNTLLDKTDASFKVALPQKLLEELAVRQARNIFTVDPSAGNEADVFSDIDNTIRLMVSGTIRTMQQDGYLNVAQGVVQTQIDIHQNQLTLNGKAFDTQPDDDAWLDEVVPAQQASAPAAASAASASH